MKKAILSVALVLSIGITFAQTETITVTGDVTAGMDVKTMEANVLSLKSDVETLSSTSISADQELVVIERIKKGTNMLLPAICTELNKADNNEEVKASLSALLDIVNQVDTDTQALLRGIEKSDIKRGMVIKVNVGNSIVDDLNGLIR